MIKPRFYRRFGYTHYFTYFWRRTYKIRKEYDCMIFENLREYTISIEKTDYELHSTDTILIFGYLISLRKIARGREV
jgi:predicted acetyltransferase